MTERISRPPDEVGRMVIERLGREVERVMQAAAPKPLTQDEVAALTGYSQPEISRLLRQETKRPELSFLATMARFAGTTLLALIAEEMPEPAIPPDVALVVSALQRMDGAQRKNAVMLVLAMAAGSAALQALLPSGTPPDTPPTEARGTTRQTRSTARKGGRRA